MASALIAQQHLSETIDYLECELAREDLIEFSCQIDPDAEEQYRARHLAVIAERLEAVATGKVKRLFITTPPRHWKSSLASEKFPAWMLGKNPTKSIGIVTHTVGLSEGFSRNIRDTIVVNERFQKIFPDVKVRDDVSGVSDWLLETGHRSSLRAIGVEGAISGRGFNIIIVDDPIADDKMAFSKTRRDAMWTWYQNTLRERLEPDGAIILIMSRWHEHDLAGMLEEASRNGDGEKWETLRLPALNEGETESLWPERWPVNVLQQIRSAIGARSFAAKFQGTPRVSSGNILDSRQLKMIDLDDVPKLRRVYRRWDLAFSEKQGADYLAGAKVGQDDKGRFYILHVKRIHGRWTQGKPEIFRIAKTDGFDVTVAIESNGTQLGYFQDIKDAEQMQRHIVVEDKPEGSKEMRASMWGTRLEDGVIFCVRGPWNQDLFDEMDQFPNSDHDDIVDSVSGGWNLIFGSAGAGQVEVANSYPDETRLQRRRGGVM